MSSIRTSFDACSMRLRNREKLSKANKFYIIRRCQDRRADLRRSLFAMEAATISTPMQTHFDSEAYTQIELIGDTDDITQAEAEAVKETQTNPTLGESTSKATNPRVQFLRLASAARTRRGPPGAVPPFQPSPPSLLRPVTEPDEELESATSIREPSPLRNLALSNYSTSSQKGYDSSTSIHITY